LLESPLIIIPDLKREKARFVMDSGIIEVTSVVEEAPGRWVNYPDQKVWVTRYLVKNKQMSFSFKQEGSEDLIFKANLLEVQTTMINPSPYLRDPSDQEVREIFSDTESESSTGRPKMTLREVMAKKILGMCEQDFDLS
jgi:hypothetical protein